MKIHGSLRVFDPRTFLRLYEETDLVGDYSSRQVPFVSWADTTPVLGWLEEVLSTPAGLKAFVNLTAEGERLFAGQTSLRFVVGSVRIDGGPQLLERVLMKDHPRHVDVVSSSLPSLPPECPMFLGNKRVGTMKPVVFATEAEAIARFGPKRGPTMFREQQTSVLGCITWESDGPVPEGSTVELPPQAFGYGPAIGISVGTLDTVPVIELAVDEVRERKGNSIP